MDRKELQFEDQLQEILKIYKDGTNEPLDGDEADRLVKILYAQINLIEGNILERDYEEAIEEILQGNVTITI